MHNDRESTSSDNSFCLIIFGGAGLALLGLLVVGLGRGGEGREEGRGGEGEEGGREGGRREGNEEPRCISVTHTHTHTHTHTNTHTHIHTHTKHLHYSHRRG